MVIDINTNNFYQAMKISQAGRGQMKYLNTVVAQRGQERSRSQKRKQLPEEPQKEVVPEPPPAAEPSNQILELQNEILVQRLKLETLQKEKGTWVAFQEYFEKQLSRFVKFTQTNGVGMWCEQCGTPTIEAPPQQPEKQPQSTFFDFGTLSSAKEQLLALKLQLDCLNESQSHNNKKSKVVQRQSPVPTHHEKYQQITNQITQFITRVCDLEVKESELVSQLQNANQILEKQVVILMRDRGEPKYVKAQDPQLDVAKVKTLFDRQRGKILHVQEEKQILQLTIEILSKQLEHLQSLLNGLTMENTKLKELNHESQERFTRQTIDLALEYRKELRQKERMLEEKHREVEDQNRLHTTSIEEMEREMQLMRDELQELRDRQPQRQPTPPPRQPTPPPPPVVVHVSTPPESHRRQEKSFPQQLVDQMESEIIELKIENSKMEKHMELLRGEHQLMKQQIGKMTAEKERMQKSLIEQIQTLQQEKEQIADQYINQVNQLTQKVAHAEEDQKQLQELKQLCQRLQKEIHQLQKELEHYRNMESDLRSRAQSTIKKEQSLKTHAQENVQLKEELQHVYQQLEKLHTDSGRVMKLELERDQLCQEILELQRQLEAKEKEKDKVVGESALLREMENNNMHDEIEKIYQQNKSKMIQMKSKLLGLKTNIEKHGEQLGVQARTPRQIRSPQEIAQEAQHQQQMIMDELYKLIDQMNNLQRAIDIDYGNKFTKINEKQRQLIAQNIQLKNDIKNFEGVEEQIKEKDKQLETLKRSLKMIEMEYKEYKDIMNTKISDMQKGSRGHSEITEEDKRESKRQKEIERLQHQVKEYEIKLNMMRQDLHSAQQQMQMMATMPPPGAIPPDYFQQLQQMQDEGMVRSVARTIQQNSLDIKQSDILNKKINELSEKLSMKTLESQKHLQEKASLQDQLQKEKQEWLSQIEKKEKQFRQIEERYKKCLEQFEVLQQQYFDLEHHSVPQGSRRPSHSDSD